MRNVAHSCALRALQIIEIESIKCRLTIYHLALRRSLAYSLCIMHFTLHVHADIGVLCECFIDFASLPCLEVSAIKTTTINFRPRRFGWFLIYLSERANDPEPRGGIMRWKYAWNSPSPFKCHLVNCISLLLLPYVSKLDEFFSRAQQRLKLLLQIRRIQLFPLKTH